MDDEGILDPAVLSGTYVPNVESWTALHGRQLQGNQLELRGHSQYAKEYLHDSTPIGSSSIDPSAWENKCECPNSSATSYFSGNSSGNERSIGNQTGQVY